MSLPLMSAASLHAWSRVCGVWPHSFVGGLPILVVSWGCVICLVTSLRALAAHGQSGVVAQ